MIQLLLCLLLLVPVVGLPVVAFSISVALGVVVGALSLVLLIPLALATYAHFDLLRVKSRFGLSEEELDEFSRLVPRLAARPEFGRLPRREMRRSTKRAAADIIRERRANSAGALAAAGRKRRPRRRAAG
jgi:hypothetical protein